MRPPWRADADADADGGTLWLEAIGHRTVSLLLESISQIRSLSAIGSKQLAADVTYIDNILSGGLGLPQDDRLVQLARLLTASAEELPALLASGEVTSVLSATLRRLRATNGGGGPAADAGGDQGA